MNRRRFLQGAAALAPMLSLPLESLAASTMPSAMRTLFVGTQTVDGSEGIYAYRWDPEHGQLKLLGLAAKTPMPTFLALSNDRKVLFACNETTSFDGKDSGGVSSFHVMGDKLEPINSQVAGGPGTTHLGLDHTGRALFCANYNGGSCSSFPVSASGAIGPIRSHYQFEGHGPDADRQEKPHVHRATVSPGNQFVLFNDLGLDVIHVFKLDAASASMQPHTPAAWHAPAGTGPRSLRFHPNGKWAYCILEMGSGVVVLEWDENTGVLKTKQQVTLTPKGFKGNSAASETAISADGRFLYASDRFYDHLFSFHIDPETGELSGMEVTSVGGQVPRYITLDPTGRWILAANQASDNIAVFARDPKTGRLSNTPAATVHQPKPQCFAFV